MAYNHPRPALLKEAKEAARMKVVARFAKQEMAQVQMRADKEAAQQEMDFLALRRQARAVYRAALREGARCSVLPVCCISGFWYRTLRRVNFLEKICTCCKGGGGGGVGVQVRKGE